MDFGLRVMDSGFRIYDCMDVLVTVDDVNCA